MADGSHLKINLLAKSENIKTGSTKKRGLGLFKEEKIKEKSWEWTV